ncbi:MAG: Abi family protein [Candidatus Pacebacteria bacterium]|nr:Abi family protein [Candidatus Paceibacterota bacterium]
MRYTKLPKTVNEQIDLLKDRGLIIDDEKKARKFLENVSYYHLSIYFKYFQEKESNNFLNNIKFDDIKNIYIFDKKLRLLVSDILERIEQSFKSKIINTMSAKENKPFWISEYIYSKDDKVRDNIRGFLLELRDSREEYIKSFYQKYTEDDFPPAWMIIESLSFGQTVMVYKNLTSDNQKLISASCNNLSVALMRSWFHSFSYMRNICAHHGRLWNREMTIKPSLRYPKFRYLFTQMNQTKLFNYILLVLFVDSNFCNNQGFVNELENIIKKHNIDTNYMGFPSDWKSRLKQVISTN